MSDSMRIYIERESLDNLQKKYGTDFTRRAFNLVKTYAEKVSRDAKKNIKRSGYIDTGRTKNTIEERTSVIEDKIVGSSYTQTEYSRFLHEGTEHKDNSTLEKHFVPFAVAPSLLTWAVRHKVIKKEKGDWVFVGKGVKKKKSKYKINIYKGGLMVGHKPSKFMSKAAEKNKSKFFKAAERLVK